MIDDTEGICSKLPGSIQPPPPPTLEKSLTVQFPRRMYCYTAARHFIGACKPKPYVWGLVGTGSARRRNAGIDRSGHGRDTAEGGQLGLMYIFPPPLSPRPVGSPRSKAHPNAAGHIPRISRTNASDPPTNSAHLRTFPNRFRPFCETPGTEFVFGCHLLPPLPPPPPNPSPSLAQALAFRSHGKLRFSPLVPTCRCSPSHANLRFSIRLLRSLGALGPGGPRHE